MIVLVTEINFNIEILYPKYCYIANQKNLYKKYIQIFKHYEFYDQINENNFKVFVIHLFNNKTKYKNIFDNLKNEDISNLSKLSI